jgi:hypothetical protein
MLFDVPFLANWYKIGEYRQKETEKNMDREKSAHIDWDYRPGDKVLLRKDSILCKTKARMKVILGPSCQFIRMAQYGLNAERNLKD